MATYEMPIYIYHLRFVIQNLPHQITNFKALQRTYYMEDKITALDTTGQKNQIIDAILSKSGQSITKTKMHFLSYLRIYFFKSAGE